MTGNSLGHGWLVVVVLLGTAAYALAEDLTLSTYYPSPRGRYKQIIVDDLTANTITLNSPATLTGDLHVTGNVVLGSQPTNTVNVPGTMGIGVATPPLAALEIKGNNVVNPVLKVMGTTMGTSLSPAGNLFEVNVPGGGPAFKALSINAKGSLGLGGDAIDDSGQSNQSGILMLQSSTSAVLRMQATAVPSAQPPQHDVKLSLNVTQGNNAPAALLFTRSPDPLEFGTNSAAQVLIAPSGRVGIGTLNPQALLDVNGDGQAIMVPRKSTTGDPASGVNGEVYYNTADKVFRAYENGTWKNLGAWTRQHWDLVNDGDEKTLNCNYDQAVVIVKERNNPFDDYTSGGSGNCMKGAWATSAPGSSSNKAKINVFFKITNPSSGSCTHGPATWSGSADVDAICP